MRVDVLLGEGHVTPADVAGRVVIVIDVLRAATTVAHAIANGARAVIPFKDTDEVALRAKQFERSEIRLGGERKMQRVDGFDFGNSPREYAREHVEGRTILYSTTNGTLALLSSLGARSCFFAAFVNARATIAAVRKATRTDGDVLVICSGTERRAALEDIVCAGLLVRGIIRARTGVTFGDGALIARTVSRRYDGNLARLAADSEHARSLLAAGFEDDVTQSLQADTVPVPVMFHDRQLVRHGTKGR
jgi:2-phosphosulfolactate phosphatase